MREIAGSGIKKNKNNRKTTSFCYFKKNFF
jgi:hypothetical protein